MRKLKGFTLLELIIVMAIFSIIMYSAVQLLDPVSKFFVRSSNFENTTACIDNMRRCIESNLKYADRVRAFAQKKPFEYDADSDFQTVTPTAGMLSDVKEFYNYYFNDRKFLDIKGNIYVLCFDNTETITDADLGKMKKLSEFTSRKLNQGRLVLFTFPFDAVGVNGATVTNPDSFGADGTYSVNVWSVNPKLYGNYDYTFSLNALKGAAESAITIPVVTTDETSSTVSTSTTAPTTMTDESGSIITAVTGAKAESVEFSPQNFSVSIISREIRRSSKGLFRGEPTNASVASFSMKNVLNAADGYRSAAIDYKPRLVPTASESAEHSYFVDECNRYRAITVGSEPDTYTSFYFIFTNPNEIDDYPAAMQKEVVAGNLVGYDPAQDPAYSLQRALLGTTTTAVS